MYRVCVCGISMYVFERSLELEPEWKGKKRIQGFWQAGFGVNFGCQDSRKVPEHVPTEERQTASRAELRASTNSEQHAAAVKNWDRWLGFGRHAAECRSMLQQPFTHLSSYFVRESSIVVAIVVWPPGVDFRKIMSRLIRWYRSSHHPRRSPQLLLNHMELWKWKLGLFPDQNQQTQTTSSNRPWKHCMLQYQCF